MDLKTYFANGGGVVPDDLVVVTFENCASETTRRELADLVKASEDAEVVFNSEVTSVSGIIAVGFRLGTQGRLLMMSGAEGLNLDLLVDLFNRLHASGRGQPPNGGRRLRAVA